MTGFTDDEMAKLNNLWVALGGKQSLTWIELNRLIVLYTNAIFDKRIGGLDCEFCMNELIKFTVAKNWNTLWYMTTMNRHLVDAEKADELNEDLRRVSLLLKGSRGREG